VSLPSSVIGFALVAPVTAWFVGLALAPWANRRFGHTDAGSPEAAARGLARTVLAGPLLGLLVASALLLHAALGAWLGWPDHCLDHGGGHLHLCFRHGGGWADRWTLLGLTGVMAVCALRPTLRLALERRRVRRALAVLRGASRSAPESTPGLEVRLTEGVGPHLFLACEPAPTVYAARDLWMALTDEERRAVLAHERAHLDRGDVRAHARLRRWTGLLPPGLGDVWLRRWSAEAERACDARAAAAVGAPAVAAALVAVTRHTAGTERPSPPGCPAFGETAVERRVLSLLAEGGPARDAGRGGPTRVSAVSWSALGAGGLVLGLDALHHLFETVLGGL
jgi:Zn-dependent protease with chaperone function